MSQDIQFCRHELEWTSEKIARFWDFASQSEGWRGEYFTRQVGDALIRLARRRRVLEEPVLDYGAGIGCLTEQLLAAGIQVAACDFSAASVETLRRRLAGNPLLLSVELLREMPSALQASAYGTVFLIETLEHLLPEWRQESLREIFRILKPGGQVVVTVPHAEVLAAAQVLCPDCGAMFHRVQHVASFDARSLSAVMAQHGFSEVLCQPFNLVLLTDVHQHPVRRLRRWLRLLMEGLGVVDARARACPNLVYIGRKVPNGLLSEQGDRRVQGKPPCAG